MHWLEFYYVAVFRSRFLALVARLRATISMAVAIQSAVQAMSHTELFQDLKVWGLVTEFLTKQYGIWKRDKHDWQCHKEACPCCCARKAMSYSGSCELCTTAWQLSLVSRSMWESVVAHGRSQPNWARPMLKKRPRRTSAYKAQPGLDSSTKKPLGDGCM